MIFRNRTLERLARSEYSIEQLTEILGLLEREGTLEFPTLSTGLFSASIVTPGTEHTGYHAAWVRDNVHIAHAHFVNGHLEVAVQTARPLAEFFQRQRFRFDAIIADPRLADDPQNRPHIRFDGEQLAEIDVRWAHAQNDALGYFVWLYCLLANARAIELNEDDAELLGRFVRYFDAVRYWEDEDSGHWEETRKVSASSIGVVVGALRELQKLLRAVPGGALERAIATAALARLLDQGTRSLQSILPAECVQADPAKARRYDAALLFLLYPLRVVEGELAETIVRDVLENLTGEYGINRYLGDSFWCTDYRRVPPELRTADYSDDISGRNALLAPGGEAQWCIFDPILSVYFGQQYRKTGDPTYLVRQTKHLNRALGQVTGADSPYGEFRCPELYHREQGQIETSETTPLLWAQANLWIALQEMGKSLERRPTDA